MNTYFLLLLMMFILLYGSITSSLLYAPKKIKILSSIGLILMTFRYISLAILFIVQNQSYFYLLKPAVFINLLCIPAFGIISIFIFNRDNKIKFKKILTICAILCIAYCSVIYKSSINITLSQCYGYLIELQFEAYCYIVFLIINSIFLIKGIGLFNKIYSNKLGAILIIVASSITLISVLLTSINTNFPWVLLADISWVVTINYALIKLKR
jgi:hypothetical protein